MLTEDLQGLSSQQPVSLLSLPFSFCSFVLLACEAGSSAQHAFKFFKAKVSEITSTHFGPSPGSKTLSYSRFSDFILIKKPLQIAHHLKAEDMK